MLLRNPYYLLFWAMLAGACLSAQAQQAALLFRGMTESELVENQGQPQSEMGRQTKKIMLYDWGTAELREGRLYSTEGKEMSFMTPDGYSQFTFSALEGWKFNGKPVELSFRVTEAPEDAPETTVEGVKFYRPGEEEPKTLPKGVQMDGVPPPKPEPAPEPIAEPEPEPQPEPEPEPEPEVETPPAEPEPAEDALAEDMAEAEFDDYDYFGDYEEYEPTTSEVIVGYAIQFAIVFVLTLIIIKISFEHKGFPVLMNQLILLSLAMSVVSIVVEVALVAINMDSVYIIQAVNYVALSALIYLMTDVTQAVTAMSIALIARGVTYVVNWILFLLLLNFGFGF